MRAILTARFSPRRVKAGQDTLSNEVQLVRMRAWCQLKGHTIEGEYSDEFKSGGTMDGREGFQKAVEHVKRVKGILVAYSMSRLARSSRDALNVAHDLERAGCHIALLDLDMDTSTPTGRVLFTVLSAFAQFHREMQNETTSDHMQAQQAAGKRVSRHPPMGKRFKRIGTKRNDEGKLIPHYILVDDEAELHLIRKIQKIHKDTGLSGYCIWKDILKPERWRYRQKVINRKATEKAVAFKFPDPTPVSGPSPRPDCHLLESLTE